MNTDFEWTLELKRSSITFQWAALPPDYMVLTYREAIIMNKATKMVEPFFPQEGTGLWGRIEGMDKAQSCCCRE